MCVCCYLDFLLGDDFSITDMEMAQDLLGWTDCVAFSEMMKQSLA